MNRHRPDEGEERSRLPGRLCLDGARRLSAAFLPSHPRRRRRGAAPSWDTAGTGLARGRAGRAAAPPGASPTAAAFPPRGRPRHARAVLSLSPH